MFWLHIIPWYILCIAHWFTSLSTLARYDEPGLNLAFRILFFIAIRFGLIPLCCADESTKDETVLSSDWVFRSLTSCLVENSLEVVPSLFALCIAHWFTSSSTLARYDEPGLNLGLRIFILHCYQVRPHSSVLRWWVHNGRNSTVRRLSISLPYFMFGRALSWGSAFAVCIVHCSLVYQFEYSGKVRRAWFKFGFENFYSSLLSGLASFLCAALISPQRTQQYCPQIEYIYTYI